jgi:hypothetical protein
MTDNESKLNKVIHRYRTLKVLAELAPMMATILLVIILALQLAAFPYMLRILNSEVNQDSARASMLEYRAFRILTEQKILDNQKVISNKLDLILINQAKTAQPMPVITMDSLKKYLHEYKDQK